MEQIRAFIAIELPEGLKISLARLQDSLRSGREEFVKWVDPEGIHLTLKFLGNVPSDKIAEITEATARAAKGVKPFYLQAQGVGAFPNLKSPKVVWVGLGGEIQSLKNLQSRIERTLSELDFPTEAKEFSPHLTLGRVRDKATSRDRSQLGEALGTLKFESSSAFLVDEISLMRSTLTSSGAIYNRLSSVKLSPG